MERDEKIVAVLKAMKEVNKRQNKGDKLFIFLNLTRRVDKRIIFN